MLADRFGWERVIAAQLEYSLLERTIESDMMPMARELGLGITPWSPLRGGLLSGKYRRCSFPSAIFKRRRYLEMPA